MLTARSRTVNDQAPARWTFLAFVPLLALIALWAWLVPYGFVAMWIAHDGQVDEIGQIPGFEVVERRVELVAGDRGGQVLLRPIDATSSELVDGLVVLGYQADGSDETAFSRPRSDRFGAASVSIRENEDATVAVDVAVSERDLTVNWWMITIVCAAAGGVLYALAAGARRPTGWPARAPA